MCRHLTAFPAALLSRFLVFIIIGPVSHNMMASESIKAQTRLLIWQATIFFSLPSAEPPVFCSQFWKSKDLMQLIWDLILIVLLGATSLTYFKRNNSSLCWTEITSTSRKGEQEYEPPAWWKPIWKQQQQQQQHLCRLHESWYMSQNYETTIG